MMKNYFPSILFVLLASFSFAVSAVETGKTEAGEATSAQVSQAVSVNLNTADAETLQRELAGIGATKAQAIVAYRDAHGNFASVDELLEVKGIGEATLNKNRDKLVVD